MTAPTSPFKEAQKDPEKSEVAEKHKSHSTEMSKVETEPLSRRYAKIFAVASLYWFVSITLVFVNKALLSGHADFDAPFFVTWFQCIVTVVACYIVFWLSLIFPDFITFPRPRINWERLLRVLPLSVVFVGMIMFNNLCLKYVGVSFYYLGRSLTTVFNVALTFFVLGQKTSMQVVVCCAVIIFGFFFGVDQEDAVGTLSVIGVIFGVLASLFVALNSIYIKKVLPLVDDNVWTLTLYNNINAIFLFIPLIIWNSELSVIKNSDDLRTIQFWTEMFVAGFFGFAIGYVTGLQIKYTSPLTHNVSGTAKAAAQTVLATQINNEEKTFWWWLSNAIVLLGSLAYARIRAMEMAKK